ncbi:MAG: hypothetical protein M1817_003419 [Caeruleum heppii]|nr:MAG: hypothetical protein M1817_003419 [Caeruleum heppii]
MPRTPKRWTGEEDQVLRKGALDQLSRGSLKNWHRIAAELPGRSNKDCRKRWCNQVSGGLKKGSWEAEEDHRLEQAIREHGHRWTVVAQDVVTRNADQCAKRWHHSLDPALDRSDWTLDEDQRLLEAVEIYGHNWKDIEGRIFPGRSSNGVKNRYTILTRKRDNRKSSFLTSATRASHSSESSNRSSPSIIMSGQDSSMSDAVDGPCITHDSMSPIRSVKLDRPACPASSTTSEWMTPLDTPDDLVDLGGSEPMSDPQFDFAGVMSSLSALESNEYSSLFWDDGDYSLQAPDENQESSLSIMVDPAMTCSTMINVSSVAGSSTNIGTTVSPAPASPESSGHLSAFSEEPRKASRVTLVMENTTPETMNSILDILLKDSIKVTMKADR